MFCLSVSVSRFVTKDRSILIRPTENRLIFVIEAWPVSPELDQLRATHDWVLGSVSWRATRPFRVLARMAANLGRAGAWNPLKWPALLSHSFRTVRTRGWRGALLRVQLSQQHYPAERVDTSAVEAIGDSTAPAGFPPVADPDVSIVIPVYNKWEYTAACLRSLAQVRCSTSFEVIVVDDQSTDATPRNLESIEGGSIGEKRYVSS